MSRSLPPIEPAGLFEAGAEHAVGNVRWRLERQNVEGAEYRFKLSRERRDPSLRLRSGVRLRR